AGARRRDANARFAGDPRVSMRHHCRRLLVAHVNAFHSQLEARSCGAAGWAAHHEKDRVDVFIAQAARDYLLASDDRHMVELSYSWPRDGWSNRAAAVSRATCFEVKYASMYCNQRHH